MKKNGHICTENSSAKIDQQLDSLLAIPLQEVLSRKCAQEGLNSADVGIFIFGTGRGGQVLLQKLRAGKGSRYQVKGFFDNAIEKQGSILEGLPVSLPDRKSVGVNDFVLVASLTFETEIFLQLIALGIPKDRIIVTADAAEKESPLIGLIDIVDTCNLTCVTCARRVIRGTGNRMEFSLFVKILDILETAGVKTVGLYNWTEPFLHPELLRFVKEVKRRSLTCSLSSNLALPRIDNLLPVMDALNPADGDHLIVSLSGMRQSVYEINHRGGDIATVKKNIEIASQSKNKKAINVRLIRFEYNHGEEAELAAFCGKLNIAYHVLKGNGDPLTCEETTSMYAGSVTIPKSSNVPYRRELTTLAPCVHLFDQIVLDYKGDAYLCCATAPEPAYNLGSFLDQDLALLTVKRFFHPACANCRAPRRRFSARDLKLLVTGLQKACIQG